MSLIIFPHGSMGKVTQTVASQSFPVHMEGGGRMFTATSIVSFAAKALLQKFALKFGWDLSQGLKTVGSLPLWLRVGEEEHIVH